MAQKKAPQAKLSTKHQMQARQRQGSSGSAKQRAGQSTKALVDRVKALVDQVEIVKHVNWDHLICQAIPLDPLNDVDGGYPLWQTNSY